MELKALLEFVIDKADDMKARDIITLDLAGKSTITDAFVICSGNSKRHVCAIAENVVMEMKHAGSPPLNISGIEDGEWVVVDMGDVVLHVMQDASRDYFQLEKLWA